MYNYKIEEIIFKDGNEVKLGPLTVIVGPNNGGKSRLLKDIHSLTTESNSKSIVLKSLKYPLPKSIEELKASYNIETYADVNNSVYLNTLASNLISSHRIHVGQEWENNCRQWFITRDDNAYLNFKQWFGNYFISFFDTEIRLRLAKETESSDVRESIGNIMQLFYKKGKNREELLRRYIREAFNIDIKLDYSALKKILFRVGDSFENAPIDQRNAIEYFNKFETLDNQGDGIRSFVAIILVLLVSNRPVILIDEPESFLHPPQAYRIGEIIADSSNENQQVIIATHSVDLLRGILNRRKDFSIIRIDRKGNNNLINILNTSEIQKITSNPLLSSSRVLDAMFYKGTIVVEADADATFYQRVSRQIEGFENIHLVHVHNKQTISKVLTPYITLGIKYAAIIDFDILRVKEEYLAVLESFGIPNKEMEKLTDLRGEIASYIEKQDYDLILKQMLQDCKSEITKIEDIIVQTSPEKLIHDFRSKLKTIRENGTAWNVYKQKGYEALPPAEQEIFNTLSNICKGYGLFIVPVGELEGWLVNHGVPYTSNKSKWIVDALEKIPSLKSNLNEEPWEFLNEILNYLS